MNLLDTASLVVTPNGYKASKLYSIIPTDGTGDMTFARTGDTATRVNSSGLIETVLANKPRLDYFNSTCPKLLLEPQRTNLVTYSDAFDNAAWTKSDSTISANSIASPDGTTNADKLVENSSNSSHGIRSASITISSGTTYVASVFVKAAERTKAWIYSFNGSIDIISEFNLTTGTLVSGNGTITSYGNGWYRITNSFTATATISTTYAFSLYFGNTFSYTGNGTSGIYAYGAQLEAGAYATSYIPTTTASVTRNADSCSKTGISSLIGQTEGTLFAEFVNNANYNESIDRIISLSDGTSNNRIYVAKLNTGNPYFVSVTSGSVTGEIVGASALPNGVVKIALAYKNNDVIMYVNGSLIGTDTSHTTPATSNIYLGEENNGASNNLWKPYKQIIVFKTRLINQELATLTSL
jgi:hypothetical protein